MSGKRIRKREHLMLPKGQCSTKFSLWTTGFNLSVNLATSIKNTIFKNRPPKSRAAYNTNQPTNPVICLLSALSTREHSLPSMLGFPPLGTRHSGQRKPSCIWEFSELQYLLECTEILHAVGILARHLKVK